MSQPWQHRLSEIENRRKLAHDMGGDGRIAELHQRGSLTARESIAEIADPGSFQEIGELAGSGSYDGAVLTQFVAADSVTGICCVDGRRVSVVADDATVADLQADTNAVYKPGNAQKIALDWKVPLVRILDGVRGSVLEFERSGRNYLFDEDSADEALQLLERVPVATAVMGPVVGLHASEIALSHFSVGVKGLASSAVSSSARGTNEHGLINNWAGSPSDALEQVRRFLSYLPNNIWQLPGHSETTDPRERRDEGLLSVVPESRRRLYNPYDILSGVLDADSFFEISPGFGQACITGLARVNGYPIGVMAKNPKSPSGGAMDHDGGTKAIRLIQLCDIFHLPMVYFVDEPGFMVGIEAQKTGIIRSGARLTLASVQSRMPYITFMVRQVYGVAGTIFTRAHGMYKHYAWASANWGGMHIEGGTMAAYRRDIETAPDPKARQAEIEQHLWMLSHPFRSLEAFEVDDMIDPRETRPLLCDFVEAAQPVLATQLGPLQPLSYLP